MSHCGCRVQCPRDTLADPQGCGTEDSGPGVALPGGRRPGDWDARAARPRPAEGAAPRRRAMSLSSLCQVEPVPPAPRDRLARSAQRWRPGLDHAVRAVKPSPAVSGTAELDPETDQGKTAGPETAVSSVPGGVFERRDDAYRFGGGKRRRQVETLSRVSGPRGDDDPDEGGKLQQEASPQPGFAGGSPGKMEAGKDVALVAGEGGEDAVAGVQAKSLDLDLGCAREFCETSAKGKAGPSDADLQALKVDSGGETSALGVCESVKEGLPDFPPGRPGSYGDALWALAKTAHLRKATLSRVEGDSAVHSCPDSAPLGQSDWPQLEAESSESPTLSCSPLGSSSVPVTPRRGSPLARAQGEEDGRPCDWTDSPLDSTDGPGPEASPDSQQGSLVKSSDSDEYFTPPDSRDTWCPQSALSTRDLDTSGQLSALSPHSPDTSACSDRQLTMSRQCLAMALSPGNLTLSEEEERSEMESLRAVAMTDLCQELLVSEPDDSWPREDDALGNECQLTSQINRLASITESSIHQQGCGSRTREAGTSSCLGEKPRPRGMALSDRGCPAPAFFQSLGLLQEQGQPDEERGPCVTIGQDLNLSSRGKKNAKADDGIRCGCVGNHGDDCKQGSTAKNSIGMSLTYDDVTALGVKSDFDLNLRHPRIDFRKPANDSDSTARSLRRVHSQPDLALLGAPERDLVIAAGDLKIRGRGGLLLTDWCGRCFLWRCEPWPGGSLQDLALAPQEDPCRLCGAAGNPPCACGLSSALPGALLKDEEAGVRRASDRVGREEPPKRPRPSPKDRTSPPLRDARKMKPESYGKPGIRHESGFANAPAQKDQEDSGGECSPSSFPCSPRQPGTKSGVQTACSAKSKSASKRERVKSLVQLQEAPATTAGIKRHPEKGERQPPETLVSKRGDASTPRTRRSDSPPGVYSCDPTDFGSRSPKRKILRISTDPELSRNCGFYGVSPRGGSQEQGHGGPCVPASVGALSASSVALGGGVDSATQTEGAFLRQSQGSRRPPLADAAIQTDPTQETCVLCARNLLGISSPVSPDGEPPFRAGQTRSGLLAKDVDRADLSGSSPRAASSLCHAVTQTDQKDAAEFSGIFLDTLGPSQTPEGGRPVQDDPAAALEESALVLPPSTSSSAEETSDLGAGSHHGSLRRVFNLLRPFAEASDVPGAYLRRLVEIVVDMLQADRLWGTASGGLQEVDASAKTVPEAGPPSLVGSTSVAPVGSAPVASVGSAPVPPVGFAPLVPAESASLAPVGYAPLAPVGSASLVPVGSSYLIPVGSNPLAPVGPTHLVPLGPAPLAPMGSADVPVGSASLLPVGSTLITVGTAPLASVRSAPLLPGQSDPFAPVGSAPFAPVGSVPLAPVGSGSLFPVGSAPPIEVGGLVGEQACHEGKLGNAASKRRAFPGGSRGKLFPLEEDEWQLFTQTPLGAPGLEGSRSMEDDLPRGRHHGQSGDTARSLDADVFRHRQHDQLPVGVRLTGRDPYRGHVVGEGQDLSRHGSLHGEDADYGAVCAVRGEAGLPPSLQWYATALCAPGAPSRLSPGASSFFSSGSPPPGHEAWGQDDPCRQNVCAHAMLSVSQTSSCSSSSSSSRLGADVCPRGRGEGRHDFSAPWTRAWDTCTWYWSQNRCSHAQVASSTPDDVSRQVDGDFREAPEMARSRRDACATHDRHFPEVLDAYGAGADVSGVWSGQERDRCLYAPGLQPEGERYAGAFGDQGRYYQGWARRWGDAEWPQPGEGLPHPRVSSSQVTSWCPSHPTCRPGMGSPARTPGHSGRIPPTRTTEQARIHPVEQPELQGCVPGGCPSPGGGCASYYLLQASCPEGAFLHDHHPLDCSFCLGTTQPSHLDPTGSQEPAPEADWFYESSYAPPGVAGDDFLAYPQDCLAYPPDTGWPIQTSEYGASEQGRLPVHDEGYPPHQPLPGLAPGGDVRTLDWFVGQEDDRGRQQEGAEAPVNGQPPWGVPECGGHTQQGRRTPLRGWSPRLKGRRTPGPPRARSVPPEEEEEADRLMKSCQHPQCRCMEGCARTPLAEVEGERSGRLEGSAGSGSQERGSAGGQGQGCGTEVACRDGPLEAKFLNTIPYEFPGDMLEFEKEENGVLDKMVGKGSFGRVMLARVRQESGVCSTQVAVKEFYRDKSEPRDIFHEAKVLLYLQDTGYVPYCHGVAHLDSSLAIVMEFFGGGLSLEHFLWERGAVRSERWLNVSRQLAQGLSFIHHRQVILNDIKTNNVLVDVQRPDIRVKYIDMGMATFKVGMTYFYTPSLEDYLHLAPEVRKGARTSKSSDVYSLGYVLDEIRLFSGLDLLIPVIDDCISDSPASRIPACCAHSMLEDVYAQECLGAVAASHG